MTMKALFVAAALCVFTAGAALAQSVTYAPTPSENLTQLQERVGELERLLQQSTGENERLSIELRRARNDNARLQQMMSDAAAAQTPAPADAGAAPAASGNLGTLPAATVPGDAAQQLREAMRLLQLARAPEAEAAFTAFVQANPQSPDVPEARYFIGRTQVAQRRFADAADTFVKLLADHPGVSRAPDSWVWLGVSLNGMGKKPEACGVFRDLVAKYPRAGAATRSTATAQASAAQCAAR